MLAPADGEGSKIKVVTELPFAMEEVAVTNRQSSLKQ